MSDFTLSPHPILAAILCYAPPLVFQPPLLIIITQSLMFFIRKVKLFSVMSFWPKTNFVGVYSKER